MEPAKKAFMKLHGLMPTAPDQIYMPNELLTEDWQKHIEGEDTCYINKQSLVSFIEDAIAENLENTTDENHDNHEGYHQACWDIIYRINQMGK